MPFKDPKKQTEASKNWIEKNKERWREYQREYKRKWREEHPGAWREINKRSREKTPQIVHNERHRHWYHENIKREREKSRINANEYRKKLRDEVIAAYGNKCSCCGETIREFLSIDHVYGGGGEHRKTLGGSSTNLYLFLKREGFPQEAYRCLCMNCQFGCASSEANICPHQALKV